MQRLSHSFPASKSLALAFMLMLTADLSRAQVDSALNFFPIHNNDLWQYRYHYVECCCNEDMSSLYTERVAGDTTPANGIHYWILESSQPQLFPRRYMRIDSASGNVYEFSGDTSTADPVLYGLRANAGIIDTETIAGVRSLVKRFDGAGTSCWLAYGIGLAKLVTLQYECFAWNDHESVLCYARINGQEIGTFAGVAHQQERVPATYVLDQNYPNPFNPVTIIQYALPHLSHVVLSVYNALGQLVKTLVNGEEEPGYHDVSFDASQLASGVYFYRLQVRDFTQTKRLLVVR